MSNPEARTRGWLVAVVAVAALAWPAGSRADVLLDRVVAVVSGHPLMLSDVRAALDLGLIEVNEADDPFAAALDLLVERQLMLAEVARFGAPAVAEARVTEVVTAMRARLGEAGYQAALARAGLTEALLRARVRESLGIEAYITQRFGLAAQPTEEEVARAYVLGRDDLVVDGRALTLAEAAPFLSDTLAAERRDRLVADWLDGLRRRATIRLSSPGSQQGW